MIVVLFGVSGSGKSTVGVRLARDLGWPFHEGDDDHPPENVAKMMRGVPLDDDDRGPWLEAIRRRMADLDAAGRSAVISCSALKRGYRDRLRTAAREVRLVYLRGSRELIRQRLEGRRGHFMPDSLLESQFEALEEPRPGEPGTITVDVDRPPSEVAEAIERGLDLVG